MSALPVDATLAVNEAAQNDLVRRKLDMDALRGRLGDSRTHQQKLREACEGFESVFLQKMWEQMRKTVSKEGYLHSKDEETYQSLFDVELSKKMTSAGGIGLADMLYQQLSQQLEHKARSTTTGAHRQLLSMDPASGAAHGPVQAEAPVADKKLTAKDLYSPLEEEGEKEPGGNVPQENENAVLQALESIKTDLENPVPASETGSAIRAEIAGNMYPSSTPAQPPAQTAQTHRQEPGQTQPGMQEASAAGAAQNTSESSSGFRQTSWQGNGPVSATPKPISSFNRQGIGRTDGADAASGAAKTRPRGMVPQDTLWPHEGKVLSGFGWEDDPAGGRRWNSGVTLQGAPGDPVKAILDGTVVFSGQREGYGNTVVLEHKDGFFSYYGNVAPGGLKVGDKVPRGSNFANIGEQPPSAQLGENSAPLFFELKRGEMALNPEAAIRAGLTASS